MLKILRVGDPHITVRNLDESQKLMDFIALKADENSVDRIEFMGDLMHTHAVLRVEVVDFLMKNLKKLSQKRKVVLLVGNHDQPGSLEKEQDMNALNVFASENVIVVNKPMKMDNIAYIPHMSDEDEFINASGVLAQDGADKVLIAHQNFTVALYSDLINPELVSQAQIITGHIHEQKTVGKVHQVGTPKWDTLTDANEEKGIWLFLHNEDGSVSKKEYFQTKDVVTPITNIIINEGEEIPKIDPNARNYIELIGTSTWITTTKKDLKGLGQIKGRPNDRKGVTINKDRVFSIYDFLNESFKPIAGVEKSDISEYLKGRF